MPAGGYFGRALVVDAGAGTSQTLELPDDLLRAYIGGAGLGAWLMHRLGPPRRRPARARKRRWPTCSPRWWARR